VDFSAITRYEIIGQIVDANFLLLPVHMYSTKEIILSLTKAKLDGSVL
jgi:hypothetical protein